MNWTEDNQDCWINFDGSIVLYGDPDMELIIELVVFVKNKGYKGVKEYSCGWSKTKV
jgi:hypothetical protein